MTSWLWPDHPIGKHESRTLREQHNRLVNSHAQLLEALWNMTEAIEQHAPGLMPWANTARAVMAAVKERP